MLYVYAIADSSLAPDDIDGLRGAPLDGLDSDGLRVFATEHDELELSASDALEHERVAEALMGRGDVLPMRFGSTVEDSRAARDLLSQRRAELRESLDRVRGAVELGVRAVGSGVAMPTEPALPVESGPGTAYMMERLERRRSSEELLHAVDEPLSPLARSRRIKPARGAADGPKLQAAYLVDRESVDRFRARVEVLERELDPTRIFLTGPWPPYSFIAAEDGR